MKPGQVYEPRMNFHAWLDTAGIEWLPALWPACAAEPLNLELVQPAMDEQNLDQAGQFTRASRLLRKSRLKTDEANELTELISEMASANIISQFRSEMRAGLDGLRADLKAQEAKIDAHTTKYNLLLWFIGVGVGLIIASNFFS